jgi:hypothetical protein
MVWRGCGIEGVSLDDFSVRRVLTISPLFVLPGHAQGLLVESLVVGAGDKYPVEGIGNDDTIGKSVVLDMSPNLLPNCALAPRGVWSPV